MSAPSTFQTLRGKVAIVTGASRGLGRTNHGDEGRGVQIVAAHTSDSSTAGIDALKAEIASLGGDPGTRCVGVKADLRRRDGAAEIVSRAVAAFGPRVDVLVNNAAAELVKPTAELTPEDFAHVYELNVLAPLLLVQQVMPYLPSCPSPSPEGEGEDGGSRGGEEGVGAAGGGRIINIASVGARQGLADLSLYCSSKAALEGLTRCWAEELGGSGHTVNCVNPGPVHSRMLDQIPRAIKERQRAATPAGRRFGTVGDVAGVVAWLAGEDSRWVTGQCISASGGYAMY
ncbi:hypothetical protein N3K66_008641 [Trichothecium roseum]|uniref:Uncharacterized protein n=1 Tax=Trichothecium roseum TaxID=47278 RepID=A0ACC0USH0_9HYPO|nr:hypothetical protein N3K66_008641 [Trichothecium roseum]